MRVDLCVDGPEFWTRLRGDLREARQKIYIQTLSFEADAAGKPLADEVVRSKATDKRIIVDSFNKYVISDRFLYGPHGLFNRQLRQEARETREMMTRLESNGVMLRSVWPIGVSPTRLPIRNHKKLVVIDDSIAYLGGINFSEHNYSWHDLMLRIESTDVAAFLASDFESTWEGIDAIDCARFTSLALFTVDGRDNRLILDSTAELIENARTRIYLQCPYVTSPFFELLQKARQRGVEVVLVTPEENNRWFMKHSILESCFRADLRVFLYRGGMTHAKAMLVDEKTLVLGSANFDFVSYRLQPELMVLVEDPRVVREFHERVVVPDFQRSVEWNGGNGSTLRGRVSLRVMRLAQSLLEKADHR